MVEIRIASEKDIRNLSTMLLKLLEDENSQVYRENVAKFGIPKDRVRKAFSLETLLNSRLDRGDEFFLSFDGDELIGFAQLVKLDSSAAELDRIIIFPEHSRKGVGTRLMLYIIEYAKKSGIKRIIANAGGSETQARKFYEKNGFEMKAEKTVETPWGNELRLIEYELRIA